MKSIHENGRNRFTYVPNIPSMAYRPHPTKGAIDQPSAQTQLNIINRTDLENVSGVPLKPLTMTL